MDEKNSDACNIAASSLGEAVEGCVDARPEVEGERESRLAFTPDAIELIERRDRTRTGKSYRRFRDLILALGEVVIQRALRRTAFRDDLVDAGRSETVATK